MIVIVDTKLLAYSLLPTSHAAQADAVLLKDPPALIHSEFGNVLLGVRRKDVAANVMHTACWIGRWTSSPCPTKGWAGTWCCPEYLALDAISILSAVIA
jgi:hypothetical protein